MFLPRSLGSSIYLSVPTSPPPPTHPHLSPIIYSSTNPYHSPFPNNPCYLCHHRYLSPSAHRLSPHHPPTPTMSSLYVPSWQRCLWPARISAVRWAQRRPLSARPCSGHPVPAPWCAGFCLSPAPPESKQSQGVREEWNKWGGQQTENGGGMRAWRGRGHKWDYVGKLKLIHGCSVHRCS